MSVCNICSRKERAMLLGGEYGTSDTGLVVPIVTPSSTCRRCALCYTAKTTLKPTPHHIYVSLLATDLDVDVRTGAAQNVTVRSDRVGAFATSSLHTSPPQHCQLHKKLRKHP